MSSTTPSTLWLRAETKPHERRTPLTPEHAAQLIQCDKHTIVVERSTNRIFKNADYADAGCKLAEPGTWPHAPRDAYILAIKELPCSTDPLKHRHIYFAHAYRDQKGANLLLKRFQDGGGLLYDLEFLQDDNNRRLVRFSHWAGVAGCAIALLLWVQKCKHADKPFKIPEFYADQSQLIRTLTQQLAEVKKPSSLVAGARGKCAQGVIKFLKNFDLESTLWYKKDTRNMTSYPAIFQHNLFFNCINLSEEFAPFITPEQLSTKEALSIIADVSCDPFRPYNPLPLYKKMTTFKKPAIQLNDAPNSIDLIAIDHLPSFLPKESSCDFSTQLLPLLQQLLTVGEKSPIWKHTANYYQVALAQL